MIIKKIRPGIVLFIVVLAMAAQLAACARGDQSSDIAGVYEGGGVTYSFAEDGTCSVTENGVTRYGSYTADGGLLSIVIDGETKEYDYSIDSGSISLFSKGSLFGVSYSRTEDAVKTIEGYSGQKTSSDTSRNLPQTNAPAVAPSSKDETAAQGQEESRAAAEGTGVADYSDSGADYGPEEDYSEDYEEEYYEEEYYEEDYEDEGGEEWEEEYPEDTDEQYVEDDDYYEEESYEEESPEEESYEEETEEPEIDTFVNLVNGTVEEGSIVTFGRYEQDNNWNNGQEAIEWIVLKVDGDKALLVSRYGLECQPFDFAGGAVTWEESSLRSFLNEEFYYYAFDENERNTIQTTYVTPDTNPDYPAVDTGYGTDDKIFILSTNQSYIYFSTENRGCQPTEYAIANGAAYDESEGGYWWWLRTPGSSISRAACVYPGGKIDYTGAYTSDRENMVRPALCVRFR